MRKVLVVVAWFVFVAAAPAPQTQGDLRLVDLTGEFDRVWTATKDLPDDQRVEAFEAQFGKVLPGFYSADRVKDFMTPEEYRAFVLKGLKAYPDNRAGIQRVSRQFGSLIAPAQASFEKAFGPMKGYPPIYLVVSFGEFDGGTRDLPEGKRLMFGADMIHKLHGNSAIQPFFHHELFHLLHQRTFKDCEPVWCGIWGEGLAVYVASRLNPQADDSALLLNLPMPLRPAVENHKAEAVCAVRSRLSSTDPKDYGSLFLRGAERVSPNLPTRFGYYVGYLVAKDMGKTRSLKQLARLRPSEVQPLMERSLARMADCAS